MQISIRSWFHALNTLLRSGLRPIAEIYESYNLLRQDLIIRLSAQHFRKHAEDPAPLLGKSVLDIGCGVSSISRYLVLSGADITAIDINANALATAEQQAQHFGTDISFLQASPEELATHGQQFDVILLLDVLETTPNADKLLWSTAKLLKPGGVVIISAISRGFKAWFIHIALSKWLYRRTADSPRRYQNFLTPQQLGNLAHKHDLQIDVLQWLHFEPNHQTWQTTTNKDTRYMLSLSQTR